MAGHNRYLRGETNQISVPVHGNVAIEQGDFVVLGGATKTFCKSYSGSADYYAYPLSSVTHNSATSLLGLIRIWFLGVAMDGCPNGVTRNISVAQNGIFRYPISVPGNATGTTIGGLVGAVTPASTTSGSSNQNVRIQLHGSTTAYFGYCAIDQVGGASNVIFSVRGKYGPGGVAT